MSTTIDSKVVEMKFDNKQFESGVQTSVSTLDKLKKSLDLSGASKGLEGISAAASKINLSPISNGVEAVRAKFSALEVMAVTTLANITNSAVNAGKRLVSAFTIDPVKTGLEEYETQINAVQTILANTESKGSTLKDVNGALDELNHYADMTIYNFTEMTRNIGTFTAAGVDLKTSTQAIKGIANLAAVSGSNSQQASTAMYQLSQALAAGTVKLQDWNSVVNAGMGGQVFQDALKQTARVHGIKIDEMIKKQGSFRETLQEGWLSSEILTETLSKFTGDLSEKQLKQMGYTKDQIKEIQKMGKTANDAATKVKTFTQLMDTLKEAAQSGWTQTWEILIGDFEEAKKLWTEASDYFSEVINKSAEARNNLLEGWAKGGGRKMAIQSLKNVFKGLLSVIKPIKEAFREIFPPMTSKQLLKITKNVRDLTKHFILSKKQSKQLKTTFKGLFSVVDIGVSFLKALASGVTKLLGNFTGLGDGVLGVTSSMGEWLLNLRDSVKETDVFGKAINGMVDFLQNGIDKFKEFIGFLKEKISMPGFEDFLNLMNGIGKIISKIGSKIAGIGSAIGDSLKNVFRNGDVSSALDVVNGGILTTILLGVKKFVKGLTDKLDDASGFMDNVKKILDGVRGSLEAWQQKLKSETLLKIAAAIGILAASLFILATIDPDRLTNALGAVTVLFGELLGSLAIFDKMDGKFNSTTKAVSLMIGMSVAVLILASALKKVAQLGWDEIGKGFVGLIGLTGILVAATKIMASKEKIIIKGAGQMILMASALKIMASVLKDMSSLSWTDLGKGLAGVDGVLLTFVGFQKLMSLINPKKMLRSSTSLLIIGASMEIFANVCKKFEGVSWTGLGKAGTAIGGILTLASGFALLSGLASKMLKSSVSLTIIGSAMEIFADVCKKFGSMDWESLGKAGVAIGGILTLAAGFALLAGLSSSMMKSVISLTIMASAMEIFADVCKKFGSMDWESLGKAGAAIGGILALAAGFTLLTGLSGSIIKSAASLLIMAGALRIFVPVLTTLGDMSWENIFKGLIAIAGAFAVIGVAGAVLAPIIPSILGLAGALALIGIATLGIGVGLAAAATGLTALAAAGTAGAAAIVSAITIIITGIIDLIPAIVQRIGEAIVVFCNVIAESAPAIGKAVKTLVLTTMDVLVQCVPKIVEGALVILDSVLKSLVAHTPSIVDSLMKFLIGVINGLAANMPALIQAVVNLFASFFNGIVSALNGLNTESLLKAIVGVGLLAGLMTALSSVAALVPSAMTGVLGIGVIVAELTLVLAAIGALAQIPGLQWLVNEGGNLLQAVGTAIGKFVGGLIGGVAEGMTSTLPQVGTNLSNFMKNLTPFIEGARSLSPDLLSGVKTLTGIIVTLTAANVIDSIGTFLSGESGLDKFARQIVPFGKAMAEFSSTVTGKIDAGAITASANAGKALAEMADTIPNTGGLVSLFTGDNDLADFTKKLVPFGEAMTEFSSVVSGKIDAGAITASANAGKALAEMADTIPNTGGLVSVFTGDNDLTDFTKKLVPFGKAMVAFSSVVSGNIDAGAITAAANAGKTISEMSSTLPNHGGVAGFFAGDNDLSAFYDNLEPFGEAMAGFSQIVSGNIDKGAVTAAANAGKAIAEMYKVLPNSGGWAGFFAGDVDFDSFKNNIKPFGEAMAGFSQAVSGNIDEGAVTAAANAGKAIAEISSKLPNSGGVAGFFAGDVDFDDFSKNIKSFGSAMAEFSKKVTGINESAVTAAANAGKTLIDLGNGIPEDSSLAKMFGDIPSNFSDTLAALGSGIAAFSSSVSGSEINLDNVKASSDVLKVITSMASQKDNNLFSDSLNTSSLESNLMSLGDGIAGFCSAVSGKDIKIDNAKAAAEVLKTILNSISTDKVKTFVTGDVDLKSLITKLSQLGKGIAKFSKEVAGKKFDPANAKNACDVLKAVMSSLSNTNNLKTFLSEDVNLKNFGTKLKQIGTAISQFSSTVTGKKFDHTNAKSALSLFKSITNNPPNVDNINKLANSEINFNNLKSKLVNIGKTVVGFSKVVSGKKFDYSAASNALKMMRSIAKNPPNVENLNSFANSSVNFKTLGAKLKQMGSAIATFSSSISGKVKIGNVNAAIKACKSLVNLAKGMQNVDFSVLGSFSSGLSKLGKANVGKFVSAFKDSGTKLQSAGKSMASNLAKGINSASSNIKEAGKTAGGNAIKGLKQANSNFTKAGESMAKTFGSGLVTGSEKAKAKARLLAKNAVSGAREKRDSFESAGKYLGKGLAAGLEAKRQSLYDKGASLAKSANKGFTDNEDINSPSKVWYKFGGYMITGLTNALGDGEHDVNKSTSIIAKRSTKTLSSALSKVTDMFNTDINTEPTIRPVLDLSDIESGTGTMSKMLNVNPSVGMMSKMQSINSMINSQNGSSDHALLSAIKDLRGDLASNTGVTLNMQMDYNAGSDANEIANDIAMNLRRAIRRGI